MRDDTEKKVFEALNNKNWGASSTTLNVIARETYSYDKFQKIFKLIWEAADSPPRNWRKIFKALMLCEYLVKNGCERCVDEIRDHTFRVRQLQEFNYYEEKLDRGQGVREKAKQLVDLLADSSVIRDSRENAKRLRDKFVGHGSGNGYSGTVGSANRGHSYSSGSYSDSAGHPDQRADSDPLPRSAGGNYSDAPGRYAAEPGIHSAREATPRAHVDCDPAPLRIKPKTKNVPCIKMKSHITKKQTEAEMPTSSSGTAEDFLTTTVTCEPAPAQIFNTHAPTATHPANQDTAFDPRGAGSVELPPTSALSFGFQVQPQALHAPPHSPMHQPQILPPQPGIPLPLQTMPPPLSHFEPQHAVANDEFGDFTTCPQAFIPPNAPEANAPEDAVGSLCSLDSLSLNLSATPSLPTGGHGSVRGPSVNMQAYAHHNAFTGLDGFSTSPQPMRPGVMMQTTSHTSAVYSQSTTMPVMHQSSIVPRPPAGYGQSQLPDPMTQMQAPYATNNPTW